MFCCTYCGLVGDRDCCAAVNILEHGLSLLRVQNPELYSTCVAGTKLPADPTAVSAGSASASASTAGAGAGAGAGTP